MPHQLLLAVVAVRQALLREHVTTTARLLFGPIASDRHTARTLNAVDAHRRDGSPRARATARRHV